MLWGLLNMLSMTTAGPLDPWTEWFVLESLFYFINHRFEVYGDQCFSSDPSSEAPMQGCRYFRLGTLCASLWLSGSLWLAHLSHHTLFCLIRSSVLENGALIPTVSHLSGRRTQKGLEESMSDQLACFHQRSLSKDDSTEILLWTLMLCVLELHQNFRHTPSLPSSSGVRSPSSDEWESSASYDSGRAGTHC